MSKRLLRFVAFVGLLCVSSLVYAQENPVEVPGCDLAKNPKAFDGKLIRVRGTLNVYFEEFSLGIAIHARASGWLLVETCRESSLQW